MERANRHSLRIISGVVFVLLVLLAGGVYAWRETHRQQSVSNTESSNTSQGTDEDDAASQALGVPPLRLKNLGVKLAAYNTATQTVGDITFTKQKLGEFDRPFFEYGYTIPANDVSQSRKNPQPTFIVPLGTKVTAIVDGIVVDIPKLYSNDYSVMIAKNKNSPYIYEMEHVINPLVKVGDKVTAGQVVAEVSDYDSKNMPGYGLVEIGILVAGNPPSHICPFTYLDDSVKAEIGQVITGLMQAWESYRGNTTLYGESDQPIPGCATLDPVEG